MSRTTTPALALALALGGSLLSTAPAQAAGALPAPGAPLGLTAPSGNDAAIVSLTTDRPCPAGTTHVHAQLFGGALPDDGQVLRDVSGVGLSTTTPFTTEASRTLRDVFSNAGVAAAPGQYVVELLCTDALLTRRASHTAAVTFTSATTYTSDAGAPQRTDATWVAGDGGVPRDLGFAPDDAAATTGGLDQPAAAAPGAPPVGGAAPVAPVPGAPAQPVPAVPPAGDAQPVAATAGDTATSSSTVVLAAGLGAALATALALGIPALLRRRRATAPAAPARELATSGRAGA